MQTLQQLKSGELKDVTSLKLCEGLKYFPAEIFELAETLELLDLGGNELNSLPADFGRLKRLKIFFCSNNLFTVLPGVLGDCPALDMVGFKANVIKNIEPQSLNTNLRWLILTDNKITELPAQIGNCLRMEKLMLAGNNLTKLPNELSNCSNLSLLRISANKLTELPDWLLAMPKLSWLAFSGNKFNANPVVPSLRKIGWDKLSITQLLGEGASGMIFKANTSDDEKEVAVKIFKGAVTSDGLPEHEMNAYILAGEHEGLVKLIGQIDKNPEDKAGLIMGLIAPHFFNLGLPPSFDSCTRDVFKDDLKLSVNQIVKIASIIASLAAQLHSKGIMHGDLYAHNILIDDEGNTLFGDFGAAGFYDRTNIQMSEALKRIEVRAFGYLLDDLIVLGEKNNADEIPVELTKLRDACLDEKVNTRPGFAYIHTALQMLNR